MPRNAARVSQRHVVVAAVPGMTAAAAVSMREGDERCPTMRTPAGESVVVHVAGTASARARGLSGRASPTTEGLLLEWPETGRHRVWMAGMRFGLDLVWIDAAERVISVGTDARPCAEVRPCPLLEPAASNAALAVLKLPAGRAAALAIAPGASPHPSVGHPTVVPAPASPHLPTASGL